MRWGDFVVTVARESGKSVQFDWILLFGLRGMRYVGSCCVKVPDTYDSPGDT
jgi:hypothetical protein